MSPVLGGKAVGHFLGRCESVGIFRVHYSIRLTRVWMVACAGRDAGLRPLCGNPGGHAPRQQGRTGKRHGDMYISSLLD